MAKSVTTKSGKTYPSVKAAMDHFDPIRKETKPGDMIVEPDRSDIIDIYERYCAITNWPAQAAVNVTTYMDNRQRDGGRYATTKAMAVVTADGATHRFKIKEALEKVAV